MRGRDAPLADGLPSAGRRSPRELRRESFRRDLVLCFALQLESSTFPAEMDPVAEGEEGAAKAEAIRKLEERLAHVEQVVGHVGPEDRLDELSEVR